MKLQKLSSQLLKYMVECFHDNGKDAFNYTDFVNTFPDAKDHELKASLYKLEEDALVKINSYDNCPTFIFLKINTIVKIEEDTLIKKGYKIAKEIKSFL